MIAIGLIGLCLFSFISIILRVLNAAGLKIIDYVWWAMIILGLGSLGMIFIGLAVLAWRTLP